MLSLSDKEEIDNMDIVKMGYVLNGYFDCDDKAYFFDDALEYLKVKFSGLGGWDRFRYECSLLAKAS